NGLHLNTVYNSSVYDENEIVQLTDHLGRLLQAIVAYPDQPINQLNILSVEEEHQLTVAFNDTATVFPQYKTILDLFEEQANIAPDNIAVVYENSALTYGELNEKSNRLAAYLRKACRVQPDQLIGVMLERTDKLLIAILGILKSEAAYVPIDVSYPKARKSYIINDTGLQILITQTEYIFDLDYYDGDLFAMDVQLDTLDAALQI